jgi:hypothetical protein
VTEENSLPDFGEHDWTAMEQLANGVPTEDVESEGGEVILTDEMIVKRVLWDVAPHKMVPQVAEYLGLTQTSEDGTDMEHREVHERMMQGMVIAPYMQMLAKHAARTIFATMLVMEDNTDEVPLDGEEFTENASKFEAVIFAAILSAVTEMIDWGLIHTPHFIIAGPDDDVEELMREAREGYGRDE